MIRIFDFASEDSFNLSAMKSIDEVYLSLWTELHTKKDANAEWFAKWCERVPGIGCECRKWLKGYLLLNPPRFDDWFRWTWELHNAVSKKLAKPPLSLERAIRTWKPAPNKRARVESCKIVTAFGPKRIERQQHCLDTWVRSGFDVVALQTSEELPMVKQAFEGVEWIVENQVTDSYDFQTQRIRRLLSEAKTAPILLLNSDCAMAEGDGLSRFLEHVKDGVPKFYLRWNYSNKDVASEFEWGLDGLLVWPEDVAAIPENFPCGIGHAMWDYAVPVLLNEHGRGFEIEHYPWLMHENHPQNWNEDSWQFGFNWLHRSGYAVDYDSMRNGRFRKSIDPGMAYLGSRWLKT